MDRTRQTTLTALATCLLLTACGDGTLSQKIGLERKAPDEFRVLSRPPLNVPPEFSLRPPANAGEAEGLAQPAHRKAESLVFGAEKEGEAPLLKPGAAETAVQPVTASPLGSTADTRFLQRAGTDQADPSIRETLRQETGYYDDPSEKDFIDKLREPNKDEPTVDAKKETERLKQNEEEGKPVTEGKTPTKKPKDRGVIGNIF